MPEVGLKNERAFMATMSEIAQLAGVSQATVSRVLNGSAGVSAAKKAAVMEWVRRLDFQPNSTARALAANRSHLIGAVVPDLLNPFFAEILAHIEHHAAHNGYSVIVANSAGEPENERAIVKSLRARQVDGILIGLASGDSDVIDELKKQTPPAVIVTQESNDMDSVSVSHIEGGNLVANHFLREGVDSFAFFGPHDEKYAGYRDTLGRAGVRESDIHSIGNQDWWLNMLSRGFESAMDYLRSNPVQGRMGVFAMNDPFALGMINAAHELGMRVPDQVSVVGFDNTFVCDNVRPTLSSVSQPTEEIGRRAVELLLKRIEASVPAELVNVELHPRLVRRESS